jgi:hypothetical protein
LPYGLNCVGHILESVFPPIWCLLYGFFVLASMQLLEETHARAAEEDSQQGSISQAQMVHGVNSDGYSVLGNSNHRANKYYLSPRPLQLPSNTSHMNPVHSFEMAPRDNTIHAGVIVYGSPVSMN